MAANRAQFVQDDFREVVCAVILVTEPYAVVCDFVSVFHTGYCYLDAEFSLFGVGQKVSIAAGESCYLGVQAS